MSHANETYLVEVGHSFTNGNGERGFNRGTYIPYNTVNLFVKRCNQCGVFRSAYRYTSEEITGTPLYGDLYLDFDDEDDFEHVRKDAITALSYFKIVYRIPEDDISIYFSGCKGVHITISADILGIEPIPLLNGVFKQIAQSIKTYSPFKTIDLKIYDNRRLFRIPNTIHEKTGLYKIPLTAKELRELSQEQIRQLATQPRILISTKKELNKTAKRSFEKEIENYYLYDKEARRNSKLRGKVRINFIPPCIHYILENGAEKGERNMTIACLAGFYKSYGKSLDEAIDIITDWNSRNSYPTGQYELSRTVKSIYQGGKLFGCTTLQSLSVCQKDKCRFNKNNNQGGTQHAQQSNCNESRSESKDSRKNVY